MLLSCATIVVSHCAAPDALVLRLNKNAPYGGDGSCRERGLPQRNYVA